MQKLNKKGSEKCQRGITLLALVITIVILIILSSVVINLAFGDNGLVQYAEKAKDEYSEESAKERLELVIYQLNIDKRTKEEYNEEDYINGIIKDNNMEIYENIVLVDGWQFIIDRTVPKIVESLGPGKRDETIKIEEEKREVSTNRKKVTITLGITTKEEITNISINGEEVAVPEKVEDKYTVTKEITENGEYSVIVRNKEKYQIKEMNVSEILEDVLKIYTKEDMIEFREGVNIGNTYEGKTVELMNDIDLECNEENQWIPIGTTTKFKGIFEGNNHKISNIYINNTDNNQGLFGDFSGTIQNLTVSGTVKGGTNVGGIIGLISQTGNIKIINCTNEINVTSNVSSAGGIIGGLGESNNIEINKCTNKGNIESLKSNVGGIVGYLGNGSKEIIIDECSSIDSNISSKENNNGGIIGIITSSSENNQNITIINSYNTSNINSVIDNSGGIVGGIFKSNTVYIYKCNNKDCSMTARYSCGGIVGIISEADCIIEKCYNNSNIIFNSNGGGILGIAYNNGKCDIKSSYNTGNISGSNAGGGIAGASNEKSSLNISNCYNIGNINNTPETVRRSSWGK